jgi:tRNA G46 methylase TrmB
MARQFRAVHVDFGTGDGTFVRRMARVEPDILFFGVDAIADNLRDASRRAGRARSSDGSRSRMLPASWPDSPAG